MKSNKRSFNQFMLAVADYIDDEYGGNGSSSLRNLNMDEKHTIKNILDTNYNMNDSINNAANYVMRYLTESRAWIKKNEI
jgi:hypothetical protein